MSLHQTPCSSREYKQGNYTSIFIALDHGFYNKKYLKKTAVIFGMWLNLFIISENNAGHRSEKLKRNHHLARKTVTN